jgi:hypothetical protein
MKRVKLNRNSNFYALINDEYDGIEVEIIASMDAIVNAGSFGDESSSNSDSMSFGGILEVVVTLLKECASA